MIIARIKGGLGNQLFQYSMARHLADRLNASLSLDLGHFDSFPLRQFELGRFQIRAELTKLVHRDKEVPGHDFAAENLTLVREAGSGFDPAYLELAAPENGSGIYLDGYWDAWRYVEASQNTGFLAEDLTLNTPPPAEVQSLIEEASGSESVCVHFRRGDYVASPVINQIFGVCGLDYYKAALESLRPHLTSPTPRLYVFSDDIAWVKENFTPTDAAITFVSGQTAGDVIHDFAIMRSCRHFITANSTLSWWAAWMGAAPDKQVRCPARWMAQEDKGKPHLVPPTWMKV